MMNKKLKLIELFGGIGAIRKALINSNIPYEVIDYVEIDKQCVKSYNALYDESYEPQSVVGYKPPKKEIDLIMHGSPCQDFSRIGEKRGGKKWSGTRSSLLFETVRIIKDMKLKPTWVIWENVKGVLDQKMRASFFDYLKELEDMGYESKYEVLNAMDFGIPQNRNRMFVISKYGTNNFEFQQLERKKTKHIDKFLEINVSSDYVVKQKSILKMLDNNYSSTFKGRVHIIKEYAYTITTKQMRVPNSGFIQVDNEVFRYLTERECFRLMGFSDSDFNIVSELFPRRKNCTSSILYKQAGNSIVVPILESILLELASKSNKEKINE